MITESTKDVCDVLSAMCALGTLAQILPPLAALLTIIWTGVRIFDRFKGKQNGD